MTARIQTHASSSSGWESLGVTHIPTWLLSVSSGCSAHSSHPDIPCCSPSSLPPPFLSPFTLPTSILFPCCSPCSPKSVVFGRFRQTCLSSFVTLKRGSASLSSCLPIWLPRLSLGEALGYFRAHDSLPQPNEAGTVITPLERQGNSG